MMFQRLGMEQFLGFLIEHIGDATGIRCYDFPDNAPSPLYSAEITSTETASTKTMYLDVFNVSIHCISRRVEPYSNAPVLELAQKVQEAMTGDFELPGPFCLYRCDFTGMQALKRDESGEGHAVLAYRFFVCYGYRCK